ncbi:putative deuterolysin metalloprotease [Rosellinia necatrix]|uniref:Neutral protease 2 n=1 Tax=Rosellinia necatrix TaxID=77044 RepID=A0A1W2TTX9_ROSNE|nr:putative deuterolysin metalloprotease [Rosellinia necatrix]
MKFAAGLSCLATLASALVVDLDKRESPLDVKLEMIGNTEVKASITNTGSAPVKVFKTGSILDSRPVEKVKVFQGSKELDFNGMRLYVDMAATDDDSFQTIAAGQTINVQWDVAEGHDLSNGGAVDIKAAGALKYAEANGKKIVGAAQYSSNVVKTNVDGATAANARRTLNDNFKRSAVSGDCNSGQQGAIQEAFGFCKNLADQAASAASGGDAGRLNEYFKDSSQSTRNTVTGVYQRVSSECQNGGGVSATHCADLSNACQGGVVAYTQPDQSYIVYCSSWFNYPASSSSCHNADRGWIMLHETTHLSQIKGTSDYNCYGYDCSQGLSGDQNRNHADSYALFANAVQFC